MNRFLPSLLFVALLSLRSFAQPSATLSIAGDVPNPLTLTASDFAALPRVTVQLKEHTGETASYEGVLLFDILKKAGLTSTDHLRGKALASYVLAIAHDGYQVLFAAGELDPAISANRIIVADKRNRQPIPGEQGPLRLVSSTDKVEARSVRMVEKLQVVRLSK